MPIIKALTSANIVNAFSGTPDGTKFLRDDGTLMTAGGGLDKLTQSGVNNGTVTLYDNSANPALTKFIIREDGDNSDFPNLFEIQNNAGSMQWGIGGVNNGFTTYIPATGITDNAERYFRINSAGFQSPSDGKFGFHSGTNTFSGIDVAISRATVGCLIVTNGSTGVGTLITAINVLAKTADYTVLATDSFSVFTNEGTIAKRNNTLPSAAAGLEYTFVVQDSDGVTVTAATGDTITDSVTVSAAAGNIDSTDVGASLTLIAINATEWVVKSKTGVWIIT